MTMTNPNKPITKQDLSDFYSKIQPYLGGQINPSAGFTPVGTVISVMGVTAPANYLACDGTVYNIADYQELADYFFNQFGSRNYFGGNGTTTFAVPDLRGEFLRGTGTNSHTNQGSGANVGAHQDATYHPLININAQNNQYYIGADTVSPQNVDSFINSTRGRVYNTTSFETYKTQQVYTSRPTNTSVLYCIATKNIYMNPTFDYSTEEKIIGTWIDGSYIYQKTYTGLNYTITPNTWVDTITLASNVDNIILGIAKSGSAYWGFIGFDMDNHKLQLWNTRNGNARVTEITIQYTKSSS